MRRLALIAALLLAALPALAAPRTPDRGQAQSCRGACPKPARPGPQAVPRQAATPQPVASGFVVPQAGYGAIFAARQPGAGHGMVVAETDRLAAFRIAELRCSRGGPGCRLIAEFSATCGAVAHGLRPAGGAIASIHGGAGPDREEAEADALAECRAREPRASCRIVAAQCGNRNG